MDWVILAPLVLVGGGTLFIVLYAISPSLYNKLKQPTLADKQSIPAWTLLISRRITGLSFIAIASFLFASYYVGAAILATAPEDPRSRSLREALGWERGLVFQPFEGLKVLAALCLAIGIFYFVWSELRNKK